MSSHGPTSAALSLSTSQSALGRSDERPLTDSERELLARLLSDPFSIPQAFKTWLVSYLESSDFTLPISSVQGLEARLP